MEPDWWARGLAVLGLLVASISLIWQGASWWFDRRTALDVEASAGDLTTVEGSNQPIMASSPRLGYRYRFIFVRVVNKGHREVTVSDVGFEELGSDHGFVVMSLWPGQLPTRLAPGQPLVVPSHGTSGPLVEALREGKKFRPYCEDGTGKRHRGRTDHHFKALVDSHRAGPMHE